MQISVIGAGTMGAGIAYAAAAAGLDVRLHDVDPTALATGVQRFEGDLARGVERGKLDQDGAEATRGRLSPVESLPEAVTGADVVVEAVIEDMGSKHRVFAAVEPHVRPDTLLATNTSALSVTEIMAALDDPGRGIGMHFFNPVRAMRLCELVVGLETREDAITTAERVATAMGKTTVRVRDVAGFATSRINAVIGNEAFFMLAEGVASAEDIDTAVKLGLNHPMGPLEMGDLVGWDTRLDILEYLAGTLGERFRPTNLHRRLVAAGRLGRKTGHGVHRYDTDA